MLQYIRSVRERIAGANLGSESLIRKGESRVYFDSARIRSIMGLYTPDWLDPQPDNRALPLRGHKAFKAWQLRAVFL